MWVGIIQSQRAWTKARGRRHLSSSSYFFCLTGELGQLSSSSPNLGLGFTPLVLRPSDLYWITQLAFPGLQLAECRLQDVLASIIGMSQFLRTNLSFSHEWVRECVYVCACVCALMCWYYWGFLGNGVKMNFKWLNNTAPQLLEIVRVQDLPFH